MLMGDNTSAILSTSLERLKLEMTIITKMTIIIVVQ